MKNKKLQIRSRQYYFDITIHHPLVKRCISGKNEAKVIEVLKSLGYELNRDFVRQHPIGEKFVIDFAFVNLRFAIEADGKSHNKKQQVRVDKIRDRFLRDSGWVSLRIKDEDFFGYKGLFYKNLIKEIVEERKKQREGGQLYEIDVPQFIQENYDF